MENILKICSPNNRAAIIVGHPCTPNLIPTPTIRELNKIPVQMTPRAGYYVGRQNFINIRTEKVGRHNLINIPIKKTVGTDCTNISPNLLKTPATKDNQRSRFYLPSLLLSNIRSLAPKVDELEMVASLNEVSIICITETWLTPNIPDSALLLPNFFLFLNDREFSTGGGVCTYVSCDITCKRLTEFENPKIESLWLSLRPKRLPRSISIILVAVIYHTTSSGASENWDLYNHIQSNVDAFLRNHPDALVLVTGDFNPTSTGFDVNRVKRLTGLSQIIRVTTRDNSILDWCLTNMKKPIFEPLKLPPIGHSDHNTILIKSY